MHGKIRSIEEIFDWYLKVIGTTSNRKSIERYKKNTSQKVEESKLIFNDLIEDILESIDIKNERKEHFRNVLENIIEVYKCFTQYVETYHTSQKQLDFLLAKDMIIPFFALFSSYVFDKYLLILEQIKPDDNKKSFQKFLDWTEKNICQQDIKQYLLRKYKENKSDNESDEYHYDRVRKNVDNWLNLKKQITPKKEHLKKIVQYLKNCNKAPHLNLDNLALFAKLIQEIHKELEKVFTKKEIELLIEHYYCLLSFYIKLSSSANIEETEYRIQTELLNHINPNIINRNHYFDDYFAWIQKVVERDYFTPYKLVQKILEKNGLFYNLSELECMKYVETNLPVLYFNKTT